MNSALASHRASVMTTRDAHRTAADEMSPMALEPSSDMSSAQGQQMAAEVGIRGYKCEFEDHALARTAVGAGSARRWLHRIWHQRQEHAKRSVRRKQRGTCTPQGRLSWHRCEPRQADAGAQGNLKVMRRETVTLLMKGAAVDWGLKPTNMSPLTAYESRAPRHY